MREIIGQKTVKSELGIIKKLQNQRFQTSVLFCLYAAQIFCKKELELDFYQQKTPKTCYVDF